MSKRNLPFANHNHPVTEQEKHDIIQKAAKAYEAYMDALGYDWRNDPNSDNTPHRVAKAFVEDFAWGCYSAPFTGFAHVAYIPSRSGKVIGLSKLNRVVDWFSRRPQVQENLTMQIHDYINMVCEKNNGVAVMIEAGHTCCSNRGIRHDSTMRTARMSGAFLDNKDNSRAEFYKFVEFAQNRKLV